MEDRIPHVLDKLSIEASWDVCVGSKDEIKISDSQLCEFR